jgi:farnesyl diphosphate synthase
MFRLLKKNIFDISSKGMSKILVRNKSQTATSKLIFSSESIENTQNIRRNESVLFDDTYNQILTDLNSNPFKCKEFSKANEWLKKVMDYNVPHGKRNRGLSLVITYHLLASDHSRSDQSLHKARVLGWCIELFQAYFLIIDDIMDHSITRRGQLCWYKKVSLLIIVSYFFITNQSVLLLITHYLSICHSIKDSVGLMACNDAALLESGIYYLIKMYFKDKPFYLNLIELILEVIKV